MFAAACRSLASATPARAFSTTSARAYDVSKLTLVGRLGKDPEVKTTRTDKEYVSYTVATTNFPSPPANPDGSRTDPGTTWHNVFSFNQNANNFLRTLTKGTRVYVEANFELREPDPAADTNSPQGQRQIFLRHENIRVLNRPHSSSEDGM